MEPRARIGLSIVIVVLMAYSVLWVLGQLSHPVGPPVPPTKIVRQSQVGNVYTVDVHAYHQERRLNWLVIALLLAAGAVGAGLMLPCRR